MCPEFINLRYHNPFIYACLLLSFLDKYICISSALIKLFLFLDNIYLHLVIADDFPSALYIIQQLLDQTKS